MASERPKYRQTHRKNIIKEATISKNKLEPGHIIRFNYGGKKVTTKRPLVLVLNPSYKGLMHGLNLDYLSESQLKQLWNQKKIGNPKTFYNSRLKKFLRGKVGSTGVAYRTYTLSSIGGLRIIDYRFEGSNFDDEVRAQAKEDKQRL